MKENFRESFDHHLAEVLEREVTAQREASESKEHRMALAHFVNKKKSLICSFKKWHTPVV